ncbi:hypothetical protein CAK78_01925 [Aeromonas sp. A35_P]|nr:hypothetical protein CAK78_01925 [Aeromonas sp. A35_P]
MLTGVQAGSVQVTASKDGINSNAISVDVSNAVLVSLQITPASLTVAKGQVQSLAAVATYSDSTTADVSTSVAWSSSDPNVATVTTDGLLTGVQAGSVQVTASKDGINSNAISVDVRLWISIPGVGDFSVPNNVKYIWGSASSYCQNLSLDGYGGWRLPATDELVALYTLYQSNNILSVLGWSTDNGYWSSTFVGNHEVVNLLDGSIYGDNNDYYINYVTCVR